MQEPTKPTETTNADSVIKQNFDYLYFNLKMPNYCFIIYDSKAVNCIDHFASSAIWLPDQLSIFDSSIRFICKFLFFYVTL